MKRMGEMFANDMTSKGLISKIYKQFKQLSIKKTTKIEREKKNFLMGIRPEYIFSQRGYTDGQQAPESMLNINKHQKNANQNCKEVSPHTCQNGYCQKTTNKKWWGFREKGTFVHYWWKCKLIKPLWKTVWSFFRKQKIELLWKVKVLVAQSYLTLCDPMDCSSPGSSVLGIFQARTGISSHSLLQEIFQT